MSDLASPLLVVMQNEADAYVCFCALMARLKRNFLCDGRGMTQKFQHLSQLLEYYDPTLYEYLREIHADDLLFCYRWLLLELKVIIDLFFLYCSYFLTLHVILNSEGICIRRRLDDAGSDVGKPTPID